MYFINLLIQVQVYHTFIGLKYSFRYNIQVYVFVQVPVHNTCIGTGNYTGIDESYTVWCRKLYRFIYTI